MSAVLFFLPLISAESRKMTSTASPASQNWHFSWVRTLFCPPYTITQPEYKENTVSKVASSQQLCITKSAYKEVAYWACSVRNLPIDFDDTLFQLFNYDVYWGQISNTRLKFLKKTVITTCKYKIKAHPLDEWSLPACYFMWHYSYLYKMRGEAQRWRSILILETSIDRWRLPDSLTLSLAIGGLVALITEDECVCVTMCLCLCVWKHPCGQILS